MNGWRTFLYQSHEIPHKRSTWHSQHFSTKKTKRVRFACL